MWSGAWEEPISEHLCHSYYEPGAAPRALCLWGRVVFLGSLCKREMMMVPTSQGCGDHMSYIRKLFIIITMEKESEGRGQRLLFFIN